MRTEILQLDPRSLVKSLVNIDIYGEEVDDDFVSNVKEFGIIQAIVVAADGKTIISGHKRRQAAIIAGLSKVPVEVRADMKDELDIREMLLNANEQRDKTTAQKAAEYHERKKIEAERAAKRQAATLAKPGERADERSVVANLPPRKTIEKTQQSEVSGKSRDIAAAKSGLKPRTAEKAEKVVVKAAELKAAGQPEKAAELTAKLNKSVDAAYREVAPPKPKKPVTHFDDTQHAKLYGALMRFYQSRAESKRCVNGTYHKRADDLLGQLADNFDEWRNENP